RAVERIQANPRRRAAAIDAGRGVRGVLVKGSVVQIPIGAVAMAEGQGRTGTRGTQQARVGTARRELHDAAQPPTREKCAPGVGAGQSFQPGPVDAGEADSMPLVEQRRSMSVAEVELVVEVHSI